MKLENNLKGIKLIYAVKKLKENNNEEICQEKTKQILNTFFSASNFNANNN